MPSPELLIILLFLGVAIASLLSGYPVAFGLGGAGLLLLAVLVGLSTLGLGPTNAQGGTLVDADIWRDLSPLSNDVYGFMVPSGRMLLAIPLFILMGFLLQHAGVAQSLLRGLSACLRGVPGGLGMAVVMVGGVLAASTGVVGASVATLTVIALPSLLRAGYGERRAGGIVAASGTLGQIIPPSIILLLLADQVGTQFSAARLAAGDFAPMAITSGDLFRGAMLPGVLTLLGFMVLALWQGRGINPAGSALAAGEHSMGRYGLAGVLADILPPMVLIGLVLGAILTGLADTTSAASFGAVGALLLAARHRWLTVVAALLGLLLVLWSLMLPETIQEKSEAVAILAYLALLAILVVALVLTLRKGTLRAAVSDSLSLTAMIFAILIGAALFSLCFRSIGGDQWLSDVLGGWMEGSPTLLALVGGADAAAAQARLALLGLLLLIILLGFVLEFIEIIVIVLPLTLPLVFSVPPEQLDPVWAAVLIALALQTSFMTPPFGFALFYFRSAAGDNVRSWALYVGVAPFVGVQIVILALVWFIPTIVVT
jgi:TRAP-type mannitol/chloroaromatic compound transport system permease large subunit